VTVTASKVGYKTGEASFMFTVEDWLMSLDVIPNSWQMNVGEEKQFNATIYWASAKTEDVTSKASWSTDNISVLENIGGGKFRAKSDGSANITATYKGKSDSSSVTVNRGDITPPTITSVSPTLEATNVPVTTKISATFSEAMNTASVEAAFSVTPSVAGTFNWVENTMTFTPIANLVHNTTYTVTISATATDMAGNGLDGNENGIAEGSPADDYTWSFTTEEMKEYGVDLSCANPEKTIPSGGYATYNITVKNTGNVEDTIKFEIPDKLPPLPPPYSPTWTYSLDRYSVELSPGESTEVVLTVSDISNKGLPAGSYCEVEVTGISQGDPTRSDSVLTKTTVGDWNPWNDPDSEGGESITTAELQEAIHCWLNDEPAPKTGAEITTARLQEVIHQWLVG